MLPHLREIISVFESKENKEILFIHETYSRGFNIVFGES